MKQLTKDELLKIILRCVAKTYFFEIVNNTPGRGIVRDAWDLKIQGDDIVIFNEEFGNIVLYLEEGTKPHIIRPKDKKSLRWKVGSGDRFAFAKEVHHPGTEARLFIHDVMNNKKIEKDFEKALELELNKYI